MQQTGLDRSVQGVRLPALVYGTAWKEEATRGLALLALEQGFRGIDTANQRRHYHEAGVGEALAAALASGLLTRDELFLQTKFTHRAGQDDRLPYDPDAAVELQVRQSFQSSLEHLGVEQLDSYVLHGPTRGAGLGPEDIGAWRAMEALHAERATRLLGVSNVRLEQLEKLCGLAHVAPAVVQNRCYARSGWDREVRAFCAANGMLYQGFSLLTANARELARAPIAAIVARTGKTQPQIVFRFAAQLGMVSLTGTTQAGHMRDDLAVGGFELSEQDMRTIERIGA